MVPKKKTWITLNVGGKTFMSTTSTLMSKPNSVFSLMLESEEPSAQEAFQALDEVEREKLQQKMNKWGVKGEEYRFDRDPVYFQPVLNYLRTNKLFYSNNCSLQGLLEEAKFYELPELERLVQKEITKLRTQESSKSGSVLGQSAVTSRFSSYFDE
eukprot:TRINITY_DN3046_c0_g1_i2.p1 TRINITY_DN3046_c0_g1~~TRINITY_DN3046_c0_g1_i2.p1  ORF type:complete len:156 (+),score=36.80 TRINITY_DN3046_c0_g1_i2:353-820(+)